MGEEERAIPGKWLQEECARGGWPSGHHILREGDQQLKGHSQAAKKRAWQQRRRQGYRAREAWATRFVVGVVGVDEDIVGPFLSSMRGCEWIGGT